jgi:hypothetical protein
VTALAPFELGSQPGLNSSGHRIEREIWVAQQLIGTPLLRLPILTTTGVKGREVLKKLSDKRRRWLKSRSASVMRHRRRFKQGKRLKRKGVPIVATPAAATRRRQIPVRVDIGGRKYRSTADERIPMPSELSFEDSYEETMDCLEQVRKILREGEKAQAGGVKPKNIPSFLDFASVKTCSPAVALVMAAEFDQSRARRISAEFGEHAETFNIPLINIDRWDHKLKRMFDEIGFFRLLGISRPSRFIVPTNMVIEFQTGSMVAREEVAAITDKMAELLTAEFPGLQDDDEFQITIMQMLGAIQEATENSCDHAYKDSVVPEYNRRWWATGAIDVAARHVNLVVYDGGNTVPKMLPTWEKYPFVASRLARFERFVKRVIGEDEQDAIKMRLAMQAPRSSTDHPHRGKGFVLFRDVVEQSKAAKLLILSRNGRFLYQKGDRPRAEALKTSLNGTLVQWDLWL